MKNNNIEHQAEKSNGKQRAILAVACLAAVSLLTGCGADGPPLSDFLGPVGQIFDLLGL